MALYGISTWIVTDLPADEAIRQMAAAGFTQAELSADACNILRAWTHDPVGVHQQLGRAGIDVRSVHCPQPGRFIDVEPDDERQASIAASLDYIRRMAACGIEEIVIHPTSAEGCAHEEVWPAARQRSIESLSVLAQHAADAGLRMAVENLGQDSRRPAAAVSSILEMIDGLGDHVGICLDIGHTQMAGLNILAELKTAIRPGKLLSLHLHDVNQDGRDHFIPGDGTLNFGVLLSELDASGFTGGRILEVSPPQTDVVQHLLRVAAVREAWEARSPACCSLRAVCRVPFVAAGFSPRAVCSELRAYRGLD